MTWLLRVPLNGTAISLGDGRLVTQGHLRGFIAGELLLPDGVARNESSGANAWMLQAFAARGDAALAEFRGKFALAIADTQSNITRVVRDPLGSHPLFYAFVPGAVLFAEQVPVLLRQPGISRELNRVALADHLCKRWPDLHETFFSAVHRLPPGWQAIVGPAGFSKSRYWNPSGEEIEWLPEEEVARFDALLDQAVDRTQRGGRTGIFLSGGFDSVSVAAVAADLARREERPTPLALSLAFPDPSCDEQAVQTSVADRLGLPIHLVPFFEAAGPHGLLGAGLELNARLSAPLFNNWIPAYLHLVRHARTQGVDTILTGEGGDDWLGTSPFAAADLIRRGDIRGLVHLARTQKRSYHLPLRSVVRGTLWTYGLRPLAGRLLHRLSPEWWDDGRARRAVRETPSWLAPDPELRRAQLGRARTSLAAADPKGGFYSRESRLFLDHPLNSWIFEEQHELGRSLGVRYIHPYWDPDLISHVYRIRPERLNRDHRRKALVRQTVARRFPALGFERQRKVVALDFFASVLRAEAPRLSESVSDFPGLSSLGLVEPAGARAAVRGAWRGTAREMGFAWNLVNAESWVQKHVS